MWESLRSAATPTALREQADRARFYALTFGDDEATAERMRTYAAELEARAEALARQTRQLGTPLSLLLYRDRVQRGKCSPSVRGDC